MFSSLLLFYKGFNKLENPKSISKISSNNQIPTKKANADVASRHLNCRRIILPVFPFGIRFVLILKTKSKLL